MSPTRLLPVPCAICGGEAEPTFTRRLLGEIDAVFMRCAACEFTFANGPWWLDRAHSDAVSSLDTGVATRNVMLATIVTSVLGALFPTGPYVDWAGGYGLLVRLMRDAGFDFYWQDAYATNLFARGFEWTPALATKLTARAITAVEVLEHSPTPLALVQKAFSETGARSLIFTQELHGGRVSADWHYLVPETGQHVSFFSARTLEVMAQRVGMQVISHRTVHLLTAEPVNVGRFHRAVRNARVGASLARRHRPSFTASDLELLRHR